MSLCLHVRMYVLVCVVYFRSSMQVRTFRSLVAQALKQAPPECIRPPALPLMGGRCCHRRSGPSPAQVDADEFSRPPVSPRGGWHLPVVEFHRRRLAAGLTGPNPSLRPSIEAEATPDDLLPARW